ncbi:MAG: phenylalanine--tRNA ligase subunit alpha [Candidatus Babeliales bacterium]
MHPLEKKIIACSTQFRDALSHATDETLLEQVRITFLARKGIIAALMDELKEASLEEKRQFGPLLNNLKRTCEQLFTEKDESLKNTQIAAQTNKKKYFDVTAYKPHAPRMGLHPLTMIEMAVVAACRSMGFAVVNGPEVETEHYNFDALNIAADHPAREFWDTLWLDVPSLLLRTHTSPVQIRALETYKAPLAVVAPGRCYRHEATDATHDFMFMQFEGLVVGKDISLSHLLGTVQEFFRALFGGKKLEMRIRPSYFPFVEPGIEVDIACPFCTTGCSVCKMSRWIEMGGAGMVHPFVLSSAGIDPETFSGFAWGMGLTRLAMLQYHINDIRAFHTNHFEFLKQF